MPTTRGNLAQVPINSDTFNLTSDLATMADSMEVLVPVANDSAGDTVGTSRASAGFAVTDARPLFIYNQATGTIRWKGTAGTWAEMKKQLRHAEYTTAQVPQTANAGTAFGVATVDATRTFNNTFSSASATAGVINILETGLYLVTSYPQPNTTLGNMHIWMTHSVDGTLMSSNFISYGNTSTVVTVECYMASGTTCTFGVTGSNTASLVGGRIKITKVQDG